jgi:hypothetical protein
LRAVSPFALCLSSFVYGLWAHLAPTAPAILTQRKASRATALLLLLLLLLVVLVVLVLICWQKAGAW